MSQNRFDATITSSACGQRIDVVLPHRHIRKLGGDLVRHFVPQHHRMLQRVRLGRAGQHPAWPGLRLPEREPQHALDAHAGEDAGLLRDFVARPAVHAAAHPRVLAFAVLAHAHHVDIGRGAARKGARHPRQQPHRPQVHVLLEALADGEDQLPHRHVIRHRRMADGAEIDRVGAVQLLQRVGRHHPAGLAVEIASPRVLDLMERDARPPGDRVEHPQRRRRHFLADAVTGDDGNAVTWFRHWLTSREA
jgi:hypothetical protein